MNLVNLRREFFNVTLDKIREAVEKNFGVITFVTVPEAEEYRKTVAMRADSTKAEKDGLAFSNASKNRFVSRDGKSKEGPFTSEKLKKLVDAGAFEPTTMVLAEGQSKWISVRLIPELCQRDV